MIKKAEIGARLKDFAEKNFNSVANLARQLGKQKSFFTPYISGKSVLGGELLIKLKKLGCDINWLLTGEKTEENQKENYEIEIDAKVTGNNNTAGVSNIVREGKIIYSVPADKYERMEKTIQNQALKIDELVEELNKCKGKIK